MVTMHDKAEWGSAVEPEARTMRSLMRSLLME
jgi:hypothetical protein